MDSPRTFNTIVEDEFIRPLILIGFWSQIGGIAVIWLVTLILWEFASSEFVIQVIASTIIISSGAVMVYFFSSSREVRKSFKGVLNFLGIPSPRIRPINVSYHERQARTFRGLFCLGLLDFIVVGVLDIQSGGIWRSPFTPMLPAIAAVGSLLLLPWG